MLLGFSQKRTASTRWSIRRQSIPAQPTSWRLPGCQHTLCCVAYDAAGLSKHTLVKLSMLTPRPG
jgi:hypothetical protein